MAKFDKLAVMAKIGETGMVPVFYNQDLDLCKNVVKACYEGGMDFALKSSMISPGNSRQV